MGGKALNKYGVNTIRLETDSFNQYYNEISKILLDELCIETYQVKAYSQKETHGDLDILLKIDSEISNKNINFVDWISDRFNPKAVHNNGGVVSWEYKDFQIDFISMTESNWETSKCFMDFSPIGNLLGKTSHKFSLKYGWDGLVYPYRNFNGRLSQNIKISKDPIKIFDFLGFDYERYLKGFNTEKEIFKFVINGKYFNSDAFQLENLRHVDRKRNNKRPDYNRFITYVNSRDIDNYQFKPKEEYLSYIDEFFPEANFLEKLEKLKKMDELNNKNANKFNGKLIMAKYPNLKGKDLGNAINNFRNSVGEDWKNIFAEMESDEIMLKFENFYNGLHR